MIGFLVDRSLAFSSVYTGLDLVVQAMFKKKLA